MPEGVDALESPGVDVECFRTCPVGEEERPLLIPDQGIEFVATPPHGIETADERSHGGAGDDVDGDACLLDGTESTDVSHPFGSATGEDNAHFRASLLRLQRAWSKE